MNNIDEWRFILGLCSGWLSLFSFAPSALGLYLVTEASDTHVSRASGSRTKQQRTDVLQQHLESSEFLNWQIGSEVVGALGTSPDG
jgi:hypothetical protein